MSTAYLSDPFTAASRVECRVRRLGERTCVIDVGTDLRHVDLPVVDEAIRGVMHDQGRDLVFDLTSLRHYETFALVRLAREWDRLVPRAASCTSRRRRRTSWPTSSGSPAWTPGSCTARRSTRCARCSPRPSPDGN